MRNNVRKQIRKLLLDMLTFEMSLRQPDRKVNKTGS